MKSIDQIRGQLDAVETAWRSEVDHLQAENDKLAEKLGKLEEDANTFDVCVIPLYEAICENRRQDAIDLLSAITGDQFRSVAEQRNLFPDRVPS